MLYFAIDAQCRSQGYGSRIIAELERQYPSDTIVLDIRTPDTNAACPATPKAFRFLSAQRLSHRAV